MPFSCIIEAKRFWLMLYPREMYLRKIRGFYDHCEIIKIVSGVRRCGKSSLMEMIQSELVKRGVSKEQIISLNLDKRPYKRIEKPSQLEKAIDRRLKKAGKGTRYLFVDEVQNVKGFESVVEAYRLEGNISIFLTGSNSYLLSGELATKLTGRHILIEMLPLNFEEYEGMKHLFKKPIAADRDQEFQRYLLEGGFPGEVLLDSYQDKMTYVSNLIDEIFEKDVKRRLKIRNVDAFNALKNFMIGNYGATMDRKSLHKAFKSYYPKAVRTQTLDRYLQGMIDAKILYECDRFDTKSKVALGGEKKYYLSDLSFYSTVETDNRINYGPALENVVFQLHKGEGDHLSIGKVGSLECDFIVRRGPVEYRYIQVAFTIHDNSASKALNEKTKSLEDREYEPLERIGDNYPKYVLTLDHFMVERSGIANVNLLDYLTQEMKPFENGV